MKSIRLNIRALVFDGKTSLPSSERITYNSRTRSHDVQGQRGSALSKFGLLRMSDLVAHGVLAPTDHAYAAWVGHSGQAGVTSYVVRSYDVAQGRRISTSPAREGDPTTSAGPVGPFALQPSDELVLTSNAKGEQIIALEIFAGTAVEVESLFSRE